MKYFAVLIISFLILNLHAQTEGFQKVHSDQSGIHFSNDIHENEKVNIMKYDYLYNGGGVGIGDFNKDGLQDVFLTGNMVDDKLYINKGGLKFEDITSSALISKNGWSTGVLIFDANNDGWDDIYVCRSGWYEDSEKLKNVLYVNNGDLTFTEESAKYGLDLAGHHTMAAPLDFDLDGDLDLYVMGHPGSFAHATDFQAVVANIRAGKVESDVLLENVDGKFTDVTKKMGILEYGYGLGLAITDVNNDGYPDIIVCNDFDEPDHLFVDRGGTSFTDRSLEYFKHTSNYSMGNDVGDFNNDGLFDYISVDMAYESHLRSKVNMASMHPEKFYARVALKWGRQYMHNMLQLNSGMGSFQEISQYAGVAKTDWSWAPLFMDIDMDGWQDLFISNGYKRDTKNNDLQFMVEEEKEKKGSLTIEEFLNLIPSVKIENFFYRNSRDYKFEDKRADWGVDEKINSNGAAYADLDNDGDLDLILNNVDSEASIYENITEHKNHFLKIDLSGIKESEYLGMRFKLDMKNTKDQIREAYFVRGFQSTVERNIFFYWEDGKEPENLEVILTNGNYFNFQVKSDDIISLSLKSFENKSPSKLYAEKKPEYFEDVRTIYQLSHRHKENDYNDFEEEVLLPHKMTSQGPELAVADFNNDGLEDFIVTSSVGEIPAVFLQNPLGSFKKLTVPSFYNHQLSEEGGIHVFDINGDKNLDVFMSSGGYQYDVGDSALQNRLYIGNGLGTFGYVKNAVDAENVNSGKVITEDINGDGDLDLLICGGAYPKKYPYAGKTVILENFSGFYKERTQKYAPQLERLGIVNDAVFSDYDGDGDSDLLVVGEWMDIELFMNYEGKFVRNNKPIGKVGWWTTIKAVDIDNDGDDDYLLGNAGRNNKFNASDKKPLEVYANDFDDNGTLDIVLAKHGSESLLPVRGRECSSTQMPFIVQKFPTYTDFASSGLEEIYPKEKLDRALHYTANEFRSGILMNLGKDGFSFEPFPAEAQFSFIYDFEIIDINKDSMPDIIAVGNRFNSEVETTSFDASCGLVMVQSGKMNFQVIPSRYSGLYAPYNAKSMEIIHLGKQREKAILVANNDGPVQLFRFQE